MRLKKSLAVIFCATLLVLSCSSNKQPKKLVIETPVITGEWQHIFNPNDKRLGKDDTDTTSRRYVVGIPSKTDSVNKNLWYTNDHCFAKGPDGRWHAYGIIGHAPVSCWEGETRLFHISADLFNQPKWEDHDYALTAIPGVERVLWAPHIFQEDGVSHMFYNIGNMQPNAPNYASWGQLCRADSKDMTNWERHPLNPQFSDYGHARDSYIMKHDGIYYYYYTKIHNEIDHRAVVAVRTSPDLEHWSGAKIVHTQPDKYYWGGDTESPFVIKRGDVFYMFICLAMKKYEMTHVYWSTDPTNFPTENFVCELETHAAEVIEVSDNEWYISNTGWDKHGLFIAPLEWTVK